ncbi:BRCA1-A complex subunit RAP80 isoform X2 [Pseudophryne corroboree]|uniref:BRCA1-A complex subunit RAP80 isoform X2 n=1 Tax=Pseudophryne corroboree TaxID=495146 RepID=UPI0030819BBE
MAITMHCRKKRKSRSDGADSQYVAEKDEDCSECRINVGFENRTDDEGPSIVISDSDDEVMENGSILPKKRLRTPLHRKTLAVKRKIAHMTEEEQLALALKISQREQTNHVKYRPEEDELLKEDIQSCHVHDLSTSDRGHDLTNQKHSSEEHTRLQEHSEELPLSQSSRFSGESSSKSPMVLLKRLSQDIVESCSVILSPNHKCPVSYLESCKASPPSLNSSVDVLSLSPFKAVALSPVFPLKTPHLHRLLPCRLFQDKSPSAAKLPDEIDDQCSHCSESSQLDSISALNTSTQSEFSKGDNVPRSEETCGKNMCNEKSTMLDKTKIAPVDRIELSACRGVKEQKGEDTVHYYWGVPFCPQGVDPSEYTKVILCQLDVYQKSLKRAQRHLLRKMDYGEPIQLAASCQSCNEQVKGNVSQEEDTEEIIEDCDLQKREQSEKEPPCDSDGSEEPHVSSKRQKVFQSPVHKVLEVAHPSPVMLEPSHSQALFTKGLPGECAGVTPVALGESAVSPTVVRSRRRLIEHTEDVLDEEITICPETQPSPARQEDSDREDGTDFTEPTPVPQTCVSDGSPVEDVICLEQTCPKNVECPMCGCTFSRSQIERHAAYCDGTNSQQEMAVLRPRHKLMRRNHTGSDVSILAADSGKYEKCYLCKSLVPLTDYQAHVDNCLHTAELETEGSRRIRSNKASAGRDGRLLSMLEQSESLSEGPNSIARDSPYVSPPREENNGNVSSEHLNFTDSPIRSFVSISEARDCLVDFKKQYSRQPNCKGASRRGKRHKM